MSSLHAAVQYTERCASLITAVAASFYAAEYALDCADAAAEMAETAEMVAAEERLEANEQVPWRELPWALTVARTDYLHTKPSAPINKAAASMIVPQASSETIEVQDTPEISPTKSAKSADGSEVVDEKGTALQALVDKETEQVKAVALSFIQSWAWDQFRISKARSQRQMEVTVRRFAAITIQSRARSWLVVAAMAKNTKYEAHTFTEIEAPARRSDSEAAWDEVAVIFAAATIQAAVRGGVVRAKVRRFFADADPFLDPFSQQAQ